MVSNVNRHNMSDTMSAQVEDMTEKNQEKKKPYKKRARDPNWNSGTSRRLQNYAQNNQQNVNNKVTKTVVPANIPQELKPFILQAKSAEEVLDIHKMLWKDTTNED